MGSNTMVSIYEIWKTFVKIVRAAITLLIAGSYIGEIEY